MRALDFTFLIIKSFENKFNYERESKGIAILFLDIYGIYDERKKSYFVSHSLKTVVRPWR